MNRLGRASVALTLVLTGLVLPLLPTAAEAVSCTNPRYVTTSPNGMWANGRYIVANNMWNASRYNVKQTLKACSYHNWVVWATADNRSGDGAVKTYPNVHRDFHNWSTGHEPRVTAFSKITSSFAMRTPRVGIYNVAYDIWLNGVPGKTEVMIWTENFHQVPSGKVVARGLKFSGRTWRVYATSDNSYIAFVPRSRLTHGTINIKARLGWLRRHGMIGRGATLGQIGYGVEIVSTGGKPARFKVNAFSVATARR